MKIAMAQVELRRMVGELVSVDSVRRLGHELGAAIRKTLSIHRLASSLVGLSVREIEDRLKEAEDETLLQLHLLHERLGVALLPAKLLTEAALFTLSYQAQKHLVFGSRRAGSITPADHPAESVSRQRVG